MNDDYLWDKTGEPDPQIQELEEVLGTLRLKPRPLAIPGNLLLPRRRSYRPWIAIAAAVLIALLATGVWIGLRKTQNPTPALAGNNGPQPSPSITPQENVSVPRVLNSPDKKERHQQLASNKRRSPTPRVRRNEPEAEVAKEQIMLAIRLASEKFNAASRKTQSPAPGQIRNQHKIG